MDFITIKDAADSWGVSPRRVQLLCANKRIDGAVKFGRDWAIPKDAEKPTDARIKSGNYKNWRNKE
ncbi:helix-turn-helix domain-containing protein [Sedimentibacter sp. B4]|uniref:helix-turn-helix domain-containing protein n=1 Tax=Sedimentibacter sp. B4 TaxID=304766 RepID=UPI0002F1FBB1|nr:helix-turn-helix domain-containing protein [Sedimentibacter sp. B4]